MGQFAQHQVTRLLGCFLGAAIMASPVCAADMQTATFEKALEAARNHDWDRLERHENQLGEDLPVQAYLDFHRIRADLPEADPQRVLDFLVDHPDTPVSEDLRQHALARYGEAQRWAAIRTLTSTEPNGVALQCHYYRAWFSHRPETSAKAAGRIWRSGQSRPPACDALFQVWADNGGRDAEAIRARLTRAFRADNAGLMRHLAELADADAPDAQQLQTLLDHPARIRSLARTLPRDWRQPLALAATHRLARQDPGAARVLISSPRGRELGLQQEDVRRELEQRIVWFLTIRGADNDQAWRDQWLRRHGSNDLLAQRARLAVRERSWDTLAAWVARMDTDAKRSPRWQYWLGRARHEQDRPRAGDAALRRAAEQRSFYGFLAARRLGRDYPFNQRHPDPTTPGSAGAGKALERVAWLRAAGETDLAVDEWRHALYRADAPGHRALAHLARERDWPELAIIAALHSGNRDVLTWRFPGAFRDSFERTAREYQLEPWFLMAVARRESAFQPRARSSAGARGLMQLMPATARRTARQINASVPAPEDLLQPGTSIRLGGAHLAHLLDRYDGNRLKALAAYNAGSHHLERWLPEEPVAFDVWIESIGFRETRNYVQAVLAYRLILKALHGEASAGEQLALLTPTEKDRIQSWPQGRDEQRLTRR